jgi:nucleotide-binding universal stress UspA family protein
MKRQAILPLVTYPDPNSESVAANAVAMAAFLEVDLHGLALNADIPPVSSALSRVLLDVPGMIREAEALSRKHGSRLLAALVRGSLKAGVEATVNELDFAPALLSEAAAVHARYFDIALLGWERENSTSRSTAEAVVFGSGRPAILLPEHAAVGTVDHIAIAWDGGRAAARAVGDATVLLDRATKISVITVVDEKPLREKNAGERLAGGLRNRGLEAEVVTTVTRGRAIGAALQEQAVELDAGLLVMGGYGHSRVRDFVLGGATQGVLDDLRLPVLLSH